MMEDVKSGKINCIVVKDLSRLGRDYIETGNYIENVFPFLNVRFLSVTDGFDTVNGDGAEAMVKVSVSPLLVVTSAVMVFRPEPPQVFSPKVAVHLVPS